MTETQHNAFPYYRAPDSIREEVFTHRLRGLDESEVRDFLDGIADQVQATERERAQTRAENQRLRASVEELRQREREAAHSTAEPSPESIALFSHAQQIADQLVEEAVVHARDVMSSARLQQREILQKAHESAEAVAREVAAATPAAPPPVLPAAEPAYDTPVEALSEVEYVRTYTQIAQAQLRSVIESLSEQVDRLTEVPDVDIVSSEQLYARLAELTKAEAPGSS